MVVVTTSFSKDIDQEMTVISWSLLVGKAMTETEKAVLRIQSVLHHLKAVNQQQLTVREQEVLTDVITSACERVAYFVQQDGSVAFRSLSQRLQSYDRSQLLPFRQKEAILSGSAVRYDSTGNGDGNKNRADTKE